MYNNERGSGRVLVSWSRCWTMYRLWIVWKKCPILNDRKIDNQPQAYACYNKDESIRKESLSGGVFTLLASLVIEKGGIVYGASFNNENTVEHIEIDKVNDLNKLRGSKYVQSKIGNTYSKIKDYLNQGRLVYLVEHHVR